MSVVIVGDHIRGEVLARGVPRRLDPETMMRAVHEGLRATQPERRFGRYAYFPKALKPGETFHFDSRGQLFQVTAKGTRRVAESKV
jgi:hypothetical protein